jgi:hypothetical protein
MYRTSNIERPHLITEFGMYERFASKLGFPVLLENQVRSYAHFVMWAAFANGHAGTPLKWCDQASDFGALIPHGAGVLSPGVYPDVSEEYDALVTLLAADGSLHDFGTFVNRIPTESLNVFVDTDDPNEYVVSVYTTLGEMSRARAFGLASADRKNYVIWLFDDDPDNIARRDYLWADKSSWRHTKTNLPNACQTDTVRLAGIPDGTYTVDRYNTWDGGLLSNPLTPGRETRTTSRRVLRVPVHSFATTSDPIRSIKVWDGADVLLIIRAI